MIIGQEEEQNLSAQTHKKIPMTKTIHKFNVGTCLCTHLLLLFRCAAQQHVEQDVRQQVDGDLVVMLDDETAAGEDFTSQLMSHLKHNQ